MNSSTSLKAHFNHLVSEIKKEDLWHEKGPLTNTYYSLSYKIELVAFAGLEVRFCDEEIYSRWTIHDQAKFEAFLIELTDILTFKRYKFQFDDKTVLVPIKFGKFNPGVYKALKKIPKEYLNVDRDGNQYITIDNNDIYFYPEHAYCNGIVWGNMSAEPQKVTPNMAKKISPFLLGLYCLLQLPGFESALYEFKKYGLVRCAEK